MQFRNIAPPKRSAFDAANVKSVGAMAILHDGKYAGRIVASWGDSRCTVTVHFFEGPLRDCPNTTGTASGYGYCKFSAAVSNALSRVMIEPDDTPEEFRIHRMDSAGSSMVRKWFEHFGYELVEVISCG